MTGLAIVAIPKEDSYVRKISSEKIPHMTLLFLGEQGDNPNLQHIIDHVKHATSTLKQFIGVEVNRRGELGADKADVLFVSKNSGKSLRDFRTELLRDRYILEAFNSTDQFPEWTPHITLGYPDNPAKEDKRDYPGFYWIEFDRIAVWTGDFTGPEFVIPEPETGELMMSEKRGAFLAHYGVLGMKWGVRKRRDKKTGSGTPFKKGETRQISDDALRKRINRLQMEKQYREITAKPKSKGKAFVQEIILNSAKSAATTQLTKALNAGVQAAFSAAAANAVAGSTTKSFLEAMASQGKKKK